MEERDYAGASKQRSYKLPRTLDAHELAILLRLRNASPDNNVVTPEVIALQKTGLVHVITSEDGDATCMLTVDGKVLLQLLGGAEAAGPD